MKTLVCLSCHTEYDVSQPRWKCECGGLLDLDFQARFPKRKIQSRDKTLWRYREAIPIESDDNIISFQEGFTPLLEIEVEGRLVYIKQDYLFPSGSYKDRGTTVMISKLQEWGLSRIVEDSSGNAGASVAAYCARAGLSCDIFVPASSSAGKRAQMQLYQAHVHPISGTRDDTAQAALDFARRYYYAGHAWNPFFFHGTKTFAYEVCEQLGWKTPDAVVLPAGSGTLLIGAYIGFVDLMNAGIISSIPKIIAIQASHCAPLYRAFKSKKKVIPTIQPQPTFAEGIAIAKPVRGRQMLEIVQRSGGTFIAVSEPSIRKALHEMAGMGIYIEPTSASVIAGLKKYLKTSQGETVVSTFTGSGLKSTDKILKMMGHK